jgi:hypothetical protein
MCFKGRSPKKVNTSPTINLGYLCGLILGDGSLNQTKNRNYRIDLETTDPELADAFKKSAKELGLNVLQYKRRKIRELNGRIYDSETFCYSFNSKIMYNLIRPFKQRNSKWFVPKFLTTRESLMGFLRGIFDAEGSVSRKQISIVSKDRNNLLQVKNILESLDIKCGKICSDRSCYKMRLYGQALLRFHNLIGFGLPRKSSRLEQICNNRRPRPSREETRRRLLSMAERLVQNRVYRKNVASELAKYAPYSKQYIRMLLPDEYKHIEFRHKKAIGIMPVEKEV